MTVAPVTRQTVTSRLQAIGSVQTVSTVSVKTLVTGELKSVGFQQGDDVHKGEILFQIDPAPYQAALAQAQATLARDQATENLAAVEAKRYGELAAQGIVSTEQSQQEQASFAADEATVQADQAAVNTARLNLGYCTIPSPIDGRTGSLLVQPGNIVEANSTVLVTINQISPIYVAFSVPQQYLSELQAANQSQPLAVTAQAQGQTQLDRGQLTFINNTIDNTTGTIQLMATFENEGQRLWPGEYVNVEVTTGQENNAVVVPSSAVLTGQDDMYVYVLDGNKVESRTVVTGLVDRDKTVISKGLQPGEMVVTDGQLRLTPGMVVRVMGGGGGGSASPPPALGATASAMGAR